MEADLETLSAIFASRVTLAKETEEQASVVARQDWLDNKLWVWSNSEKPGSFIWFCHQFDLVVEAVRRAILEGK